MNKIKLCFIVSNLTQGGAEKQFFLLISNIDKTKFEVDLIIYAKQKPIFYDISALKNVNIYTNKLNYRFPPFKIFEALFFLRRMLLNVKYDLVFTTLFMNNLFVRLSVLFSYNNKIITNIRTSLENYNPFYLFCEKLLIINSHVIFNSKKSLDSFSNIVGTKYQHNLHLIYNGFDTTNHLPISKISNQIVIGGLGRFSYEKNFIQLVRVFKSKSLKNKTQLKLLLQGSISNQYDDIVNVSVNIGNIFIEKPSPEIDIFFTNINILVIPSHFEGCPNVLFESMIRNTLCLISVNANTDNFITNNVNGFIYDGSDKNLIKSLNHCISILNTNKANEIITNAKNYAFNNFSIEKMVKKNEKIFNTIYEKNKSGN